MDKLIQLIGTIAWRLNEYFNVVETPSHIFEWKMIGISFSAAMQLL